MLTLTSCSSTSSTPTVETTTAASTQQGVPGGVVVETHKMTATVTGIDAANRKVTLVTPGGEKTTVKCGPEVINFDQIRVGDQLKVKVTEELAIYMAAEGAPPSDGAATVVALAPKGAKPGGIVANTVQITAKVTAIDLKHHKATLQFPDGTTRTVAVRKDVDLTKRQVGEEVVIRSTEALAISVEKP
jgi:Cu/Ag efflux protein CusF